MAAKKKAGEDQSRILTAEDLFKGGEEPIQRLELPMIVKDGKPGVVFIRKISTEEVLEHNAIEDGDAKRDSQLTLFAKAVCVDADGTAMFTSEHDERLGAIPIGAFNIIMNAIVGDMGAEAQAAGDVDAAKKD